MLSTVQINYDSSKLNEQDKEKTGEEIEQQRGNDIVKLIQQGTRSAGNIIQSPESEASALGIGQGCLSVQQQQ